jgi:hypothetical protein
MYFVSLVEMARLAANTLNMQPPTADKGWSSSLGVGRGPNNPSPYKINFLRNFQKNLRPGFFGKTN